MSESTGCPQCGTGVFYEYQQGFYDYDQNNPANYSCNCKGWNKREEDEGVKRNENSGLVEKINNDRRRGS